jgi:hypothetical protein
MKSAEPAKVYQFKVTLNNIHPPVWRRILVSNESTLLDLNNAIQDVFGWLDYHLHEFMVEDVRYGDPANDEFDEFAIQDEAKVKLRKLNLKEGSRFTYEYDFGDSWEHTLVLEKIVPLERGMKLPQCIKGKRACPPEDVGGPWGYEGFLEAIHDPQNEEHESYLQWIGGEFDPEAFDLDAVNQRLRQRAEQDWPGSTPPATEEEQTGQKSLFTPSRWENFLNEAGEQTAQGLPLRQNVVSFLVFLKENKVIGTQSTGNLPRKVVEAVSIRFVKPPVLETKIGDTVFRFQNEADVWPIYFVHVLTQAADLVSGGPSRRWRLTPTGEQFLTLSPVLQVWFLFAAWWFRVNWLIAYSWDIFGGALPEHFNKTVASLLFDLPVDKVTPFEPFANQIIQKDGWTWPKQEHENTWMIIRAAIEHMVIGPLENFGVLTTQHEKDPSRQLDIQMLVSFTKTSFGHALLETVSKVG